MPFRNPWYKGEPTRPEKGTFVTVDGDESRVYLVVGHRETTDDAVRLVLVGNPGTTYGVSADRCAHYSSPWT